MDRNNKVTFDGVVRQAAIKKARNALSDLVLAWANDAASGAAKYILEVETGQSCGCLCPGCGGRLEAVNSRNPRWKKRPHFRHCDTPHKELCSIVAARVALLRTLTELDTFDLPGRRRTASVTGLSGATYEAVAADPGFRAAPEAIDLLDSHRALVKLDDGRELIVEIRASLSRPNDIPASQSAVIQVVSDDPEVAGLAPEDLRQRLRVLLRDAAWCHQWNDTDLDSKALAAATENARRFLDAADGSDGVTTYEGALHRTVKEILAEHLWMQVPGLTVQISRTGIGDRQWLRTWETDSERMTFSRAWLETHIGQSVPDVIVEHEHGPICIEITVTNPLTEEREFRYRQMGIPVLELDMRALAGKVTREELTNLVLTDIGFKRWAYHPRQTAERERLLAEYEDEVGRYLASDLAELVQEAKKRAVAWYDSDYAEELKAPLQLVMDHIESRGCYGASSSEFFGFHAILPRLLSIALGRPVGYRYKTVYEVINALASAQDENQCWSTLYLAAIKTYRPELSEKHARWVENWREEIAARFVSGDALLQRPSHFDRTIAAFFPEMDEPLRKLRAMAESKGEGSGAPATADNYDGSRTGGRRGAAGYTAIIEGKPYSREELREYLARKGLVRRRAKT